MRPSLLARAAAERDDDDSDYTDAIASSSSIPSSSTPTSSSSSSDFFTPPDDETAWLTKFLPFSRLSLDAATWLAANPEREVLSPGQKVLVPGALSFFPFSFFVPPFCYSLRLTEKLKTTKTHVSSSFPSLFLSTSISSKHFVSTGGPPALVAVRSGRVGVARAVGISASSSSSSSPPSRYTAAGSGASFGASDLLADTPSRGDVVALGVLGDGDSSSSSSLTSASTRILRIAPAILSELARKFPGAERALLSGAVDAGEEAAALAAADAAALRQELRDAAERAAALQPFLVTSPKRGIVGASRYASRLRRDIVAASRDPARGPVFVFGEPGLNKDDVAALVHFGSADRFKPMVCVDCGRLSGDGADLFGRGARPGLLSALRDGTLLLNNVHLAPPSLADALVQLLASGDYTRAPSPRRAAGAGDLAPAPILRSRARIMITAERRAPRFEALMAVIRVPPLRVRPAVVAPLADFFLRDLARRTGAAAPPTLSAAALRQLEAYSFPDNIAELQSAVERAAVHSGDRESGGARAGGGGGGAGGGKERPSSSSSSSSSSSAEANQVVPAAGLVNSKTTRGAGGGIGASSAAAVAAAAASGSGSSTSSSSSGSGSGGGRKPVKAASMPLLASVDGVTISADALWFATVDSDRGRINLLQTLPWLKTFVRSDFWRDTLPFKIVAPFYVFYVAYLFLGP